MTTILLDVPGIEQALVELRDGGLSLPHPAQLAAFTRARLAENLAGHLNRIVANHPNPYSTNGRAILPAPAGNHDFPETRATPTVSDCPHYPGA
jgi:hypothetical protein